MEKKIFRSLEDTKEFAKNLANILKVGDTLLLKGDLGAGKTTLSKFLLAELGVKEVVSSPTFVIMKNYLGKMPIYHIDAYRLDSSEEDLGFADYLDYGLLVIEWPEKLVPFWDKYYEVALTYKNDFEREAVIRTNIDIVSRAGNFE